MDINTTKNQQISLVKKINSESPELTLEFHQQEVSKKICALKGVMDGTDKLTYFCSKSGNYNRLNQNNKARSGT